MVSTHMARLWLSVEVVSGCTVLFGARIINCSQEEFFVKVRGGQVLREWLFFFIPATWVYFMSKLAWATKHQVGLALTDYHSVVIQLFPNSPWGWCVECGMDTTAEDRGGSDLDCICGQRRQSMDMVSEGERNVLFGCVYHVPGSLRGKKKLTWLWG